MKKKVINEIENIFFVIVFVVAFTVPVCMVILNEIVVYPPELPNLYDYYAAVVGDGLFIPMLILSGFFYLKKNQFDFSSSAHRAALPISLLMLLVGMGIQISWLMNDAIALNWTIPAPHYFNIAGWIHAFYFVFMFFACSYIIVSCTGVFTNNYKSGITDNYTSYIIMWLSIYAYWMMHARDDYMNYDNYGKWIILSTIVFMILIFIAHIIRIKSIDKSFYLKILAGLFVIDAVMYWLCSKWILDMNYLQFYHYLDERIGVYTFLVPVV